jgi:hypothetical protein
MSDPEPEQDDEPKWFRVRVDMPPMEKDKRPRTVGRHTIHAMSREDLYAGIPESLHKYVHIEGMHNPDAKPPASPDRWKAFGRGVVSVWRRVSSKDARP